MDKSRPDDLTSGVAAAVNAGVEAQRHKAAGAIGNVAEGVRRAGDELDSHHAALGAYARLAGDHIDDWAEHVRSTDLPTMADELSTFARRRPALFVGGALVIGYVLARFLRSSAPDAGSIYTSRDDDAPSPPSWRKSWKG